jgi:hypothetical protein
MRQTTFLRTPIRADHQSRLLNLQVAEQALAANPSPTDVYPQTLLINFGIAAGTSEVQIAPLWEGSFRFLADSTDGYPTDPSEVTEANFPQWKLVGDLVLESGVKEMIDMRKAFGTQLPLISPPPSIVRYSKIRLTRDFLFVTMSGLQNVRFIRNGKVVDSKDPQWREKLIIAFLQGQAGVFCNVHNSDPTQDLALQPMPSVSLQPAGSVTTFRVAIANRAPELANQTNWFAPQPEIDDIFADPLADPGFRTRPDWSVDPGHPSHSVISTFALFTSALPAAYATEHGLSTPLRVALTAPRNDGKTYRRIDLLRATAPTTMGNASSYPQRPFPMHQLSWQLIDASEPAESLRIPLSGRLYVPLANGQLGFWANPRFRDNPEIDPEAKLMLSIRTPDNKFLSMPTPAVDLTIGAADSAISLYANLLEYDGTRAWTVIRDKKKLRDQAIAAGEKRWNVTVLKLFINPKPTMITYARVYGLIREAAMRHGLAPEFLHAVFMGEGVGGANGLLEARANMADPPTFEQREFEPIDSITQLGLDWIADDLPTPVGKTPIPTGDQDIALQALLTQHYLDPQFGPTSLVDLDNYRTEAKVLHMTGKPVGWLAAIELVAAEAHARLDMMLRLLDLADRDPDAVSETQRRWLTYVRYNTEMKFDTWMTLGRNLDHWCVRWRRSDRPGGPKDPSFSALEQVTYNSLQHLPVAEWYEQVGVYR